MKHESSKSVDVMIHQVNQRKQHKVFGRHRCGTVLAAGSKSASVVVWTRKKSKEDDRDTGFFGFFLKLLS